MLFRSGGKSIDDILIDTKFVKIHKVNETWTVENAKKNTIDLFTKLNAPLPKEYVNKKSL